MLQSPLPNHPSQGEGPRELVSGWRRPLSIVAAVLALAAVRPLQAAEPNQLAPEQIAAGWINLFDGETLFGWTPTSDANWKVEDGAITVSEGEQGFLATNAEFADYELHVEFKAPASTNSGIFLRTPLKPSDPATDCIELNVAPVDNPFPTGSLVGRTKWDGNPLGGSLPLNADAINAAKEGWSTFDIVLRKDVISVVFDEGRKLLFTEVTGPRRGHISLQFREGPIAFRNIRLKPRGLKPMLNGKDLAGWNADKAEASKFEIVTPLESSGSLPVEGRGPEDSNEERYELHVTNGRGQLETNDSYGDFVMQLDCRVDGDGLNSGVFYRCIPRDFLNGYECQIHNVYKDNDPTKPADFGTGAIYRRVPARRVVSKDHEWFTMTLIPTGPHVAVWVNGYQTTDWTDDRPEHENPRNGLRTKPGTIAIQGHDPTTNLRFRNLRIVELPKAEPIAN